MVRLKDIFREDLYVELQDHGIPEQKRVNPELIALAEELDIPIVASNDVHYLNADDASAHEVLKQISPEDDDSGRAGRGFGSDQFYFKTADEMANLFPQEYLTRTLEVAEKCSLELDLSVTHSPEFTPPEGFTPEEYLWQRIQEGVQTRYGGQIDEAQRERLEYEYGVIRQTGFCGYFLIIDDMVQYARRQRIRVGPGRGSCVASLVCYVLGITDVDPVENDLLFERFLTPDRITPPDIDIDFQHNRRHELVDYMGEKYGYALLIVSFNRLLPRSLVRQVGKVFGIDPKILDAAAKSIPKYTDKNLSELSQEIDRLRELDPRIIEIGTKLHGMARNMSKHPAGIVVSRDELTDVIPLCVSKRKDTLTQYDKDSLVACRMLKIDALSSEYLTVVDKAIGQIEDRHGVRLTDFPEGDSDTYLLLCSGDVAGEFQLDERWGEELIVKMQPCRFENLVHAISLGRPGVIDSGLLDQYFHAKNTGKWEYLHSSLEPILSESFGVILFQEQIMRIAAEIAGFSWTDSDRLRKAIGDKDMRSMEAKRLRFIDGCVGRNIPREIAEELWNNISFFGGYGFNKAHAVGYATLTYQTAFLKTHYRLEYMSSLLSVKADKKDKRKQYMRETMREGFRFLPPDINVANDEFVILNDGICVPLTSVGHVGPATYQAIILERENGEFLSYDDFCERTPRKAVNISVRKNLIQAGSFDRLHDRRELLESVFEIPEPDILRMEWEALGIYISSHPLDGFCYDSGTLRISEVNDLPMESEFRTVAIIDKVDPKPDRHGRPMAHVTIEDGLDQIRLAFFHRLYSDSLVEGLPIRVVGRLNERGPVADDYEVLNLQASALVPA